MADSIKDMFIRPSLCPGVVRLIVEFEDGSRYGELLTVEYEVPLEKIPILVRSEAGILPQELLDALMDVYLREMGYTSKVSFWKEYYKERRRYKRDHAEMLMSADEAYRLTEPIFN